MSASEPNGTLSGGGNCYLPGSANNGYGTGPGYIPINYASPNASTPSSEGWTVYAIDTNGTGYQTCTFDIYGSNGEHFSLVGTY